MGAGRDPLVRGRPALLDAIVLVEQQQERRRGKGVNPTSEADLNPWPAPFDQPFYLVMNVAVGGRFLGNPDKTTVFPAEMVVDYVRVYDKVGGYGKPKPRGKGKLPFAKR